VADGDGLAKPMRVVIGIMLMTAFVMICWALIARYAGGWGVPYFSFQTDRGSTCRNDLIGYTCTEVTVPDINFYGEVNLPSNTRVVSSKYRSTHDYALSADLLVPANTAPVALRALYESFGTCQPDHPAPMNTTGLVGVCVLVNDDTITRDVDTSSRLYAVGTGLRKDGSRVISMTIKSR
jgi:hypothetical protein